MKVNVKSKKSASKRSMMATGGGGPSGLLSELEERVAAIMGPVSFEGIPTGEESMPTVVVEVNHFFF